jgi:hypothetical protein
MSCYSLSRLVQNRKKIKKLTGKVRGDVGVHVVICTPGRLSCVDVEGSRRTEIIRLIFTRDVDVSYGFIRTCPNWSWSGGTNEEMYLGIQLQFLTSQHGLVEILYVPVTITKFQRSLVGIWGEYLSRNSYRESKTTPRETTKPELSHRDWRARPAGDRGRRTCRI